MSEQPMSKDRFDTISISAITGLTQQEAFELLAEILRLRPDLLDAS
jgi:hypothetical protein